MTLSCGSRLRKPTWSALDYRRVVLARARQFTATINARGGNATLLHLPDIGIHGNTHFPFSDLNNIEVADGLSRYLHEKGLDGVS